MKIPKEKEKEVEFIPNFTFELLTRPPYKILTLYKETEFIPFATITIETKEELKWWTTQLENWKPLAAPKSLGKS